MASRGGTARVDGVRVDGVRGSNVLLCCQNGRVCLCGPATVRTKRCSYCSQEIRRCTELCQSAAVALFDCFQGTAAVELLLASVLHR